jgi:hypothetical protein
MVSSIGQKTGSKWQECPPLGHKTEFRRVPMLGLLAAMLQQAQTKSGATTWIWWVVLAVLLVLLFMRRKSRKAKN